MRSVLVALYELHADEVFVVGHHDCGMMAINPTATLEKMVQRGGISIETIRTLEYAGINLKKWLHGFESVQESVRNSVSVIRNHPLVPRAVPVHGLIIDPSTGKLELMIDGNKPTRKMSDAGKSPAPASPPLTGAGGGGEEGRAWGGSNRRELPGLGPAAGVGGTPPLYRAPSQDGGRKTRRASSSMGGGDGEHFAMFNSS